MFPFDDSDSQTLTEHLLGIRRRPVERSTYSPLSIVVARPHQRKRATRARSTPIAAAPAAPPSTPRRAPTPPPETPGQRAIREGVERERAAFRDLLDLTASRGMHSHTAVDLACQYGTAHARELVESVPTDAPDPDTAARLAAIAGNAYAHRQAIAEQQREQPAGSAPVAEPGASSIRSFDDPTSIDAIYRRRQAAMDDAAARRQAERGESAPPAEPPSTPSAPPRTLDEIDATSIYQRRQAVMDEAAAARKRGRSHEEE